MKQAKKMLCMLLVMLLAFSTVSIGVNAAYTSYAAPTSYSLHDEPILSTAQRGSQLLDFVDAMLYDMRDDLYIDITVMKLNFTSVDKALDTIAGLDDAANLIGGDVGDLNIDALGKTRRGTAGKTDLDILYELLYFLNDNRGIVGRFVKGELDLGLLGTFGVDLDIDVYVMLKDMLYEMLVDESVDVCPAGWTADSMLQHAVDVLLLGGTAANGDIEEGFLPSMAGKTNINTQTIWQIIENAANAATKDILIPLIENELKPNIEKWKVEMPSDAWNLIDLSKLDLSGYTWAQYDPTNGIVAELNHFIYYVLNQVWVGDPFWVDGGNDKLQDNLASTLKVLYKELGDVLLPATSEFLPQEEIDAMDLQQLVAYVAKQFLVAEMPYVIWEHFDETGMEVIDVPTDNIGQIACYVAYSIAADILPTNYMDLVDMGIEEFGKDLALDIITDIGAYYLNGALPVQIQYGMGPEQLLSDLVNWALGNNNFGGFFKGCGVSDSDSVWKKIDKTVLTVLPLHQIFGGNVTGSEDLVMNRLLGSIFDLDLENLLEILYKSNTSALNKTVPQFVVWLVNGVLNVIVTRNTQPALISTSLTTVDAIIQNANLAGTAERLLNGLYNAGRYQYFWDSLLPILNPLLIDESGYSYNVVAAPAGYSVQSVESLQTFIEGYEALLEMPEDRTNLDGNAWHQSTDYTLWRFDKLEDVIDDAWDVVNGYKGAVEWVAAANEALAAANASGDANAVTAAQEDLNAANAELASYTATRYANAAYKIEYYAGKVTANQNEAEQTHLQYVLWLADAKMYDEGDYDEKVWAEYEAAYDHADEVNNITPYDDSGKASPDLKQSMVNEARKMLLDAMLKLEVKLADLAELEKYYNEVKNASTEGYSDETVAAFEAALAKAVEVLAEVWTAADQDMINEVLADLKAAYEGLKAAVEIILPKLETLDSGVLVAEAAKLIAGLATQLTPDALLNDYVNSDANGRLVVETVVDGVVGTGTKLTLMDAEDNIVEEYEAVIFGDANGDGIVDLMDTICLDLYTVYETNYANGSAQWYALNLNADAAVDAADAVILDNYANFEGEIDQQAIYPAA